MTLGGNLRAIRKSRDLNQGAVAILIGKSIAFISQLETDQRRPSFAMACKLADALGVTLNDLRPR